MRLFSMILGFIVGVIVTRNAEPMSSPSTGAVFFGMAVACWIIWKHVMKDKGDAIATAVAVATARATATAESNAQAVAQQAVYIMTSGVVPPNALPGAVEIAGERYQELPLKVAPALVDTVVSSQATREGTHDEDSHHGMHVEGREPRLLNHLLRREAH